MSLSKLNKGQKVDWSINTEGWSFKKAADLELNKDYAIKGCFVTPDKGYGEGAVIISDNVLINAPASFLDTCKEILADQESIDAIKEGNETFHLEERTSRKFKRTYRVVILN